MRIFASLLLFVSLYSHSVLQAPAPNNVAKPPQNAIPFSEGLHYIVLEKGSGRLAKKQFIKSLSTAWTSVDGQTRFNAEEDGIDVSDPAGLLNMLPGFATALKNTPIGEKRRWWVSAALMQPGWKGMAAGDYTIDLAVLGQLDPLPAPAHVDFPPANATATESGLKYIVLKQGSGKAKPVLADTVRVHYSGWTPDGRMFDSSILRERPIEFPVERVIKGWKEGVQLMTVGSQFRFWIPQRLAYGDNPRPGAPKGDLVFDVELFDIISPPPKSQSQPGQSSSDK